MVSSNAKFLMFFLFIATTSIRTSTYSTVLSYSNAVFTRPFGYGNHFYVAIQITVASRGDYTFQSSSNLDTYGYLYNAPFSSSTPQTNLVDSNDDSAGNRQFQLTATLPSRGSIILVVTTYSPETTGDIAVTVTGPSSLTFALLSNPTTTTTRRTTTTTRRTTTTTRRTTITTRRTTSAVGPRTSTYSTVLSNSNAVFTRPSGYGNYFYVAIQVTVARRGDYTFQSRSILDTYGCLYNAPFSPSTPETNLVDSNDDSAESVQFQLTATLPSRGSIILVVTTYSPQTTGDIAVTVTGPSSVTFVLMTI